MKGHVTETSSKGNPVSFCFEEVSGRRQNKGTGPSGSLGKACYLRAQVRPADVDVLSCCCCMPGGVVLSGNGQALCVNLSVRKPLSWHVVHSVPCSASRCTCAEHQSGPPATQSPLRYVIRAWAMVVVPAGL